MVWCLSVGEATRRRSLSSHQAGLDLGLPVSNAGIPLRGDASGALGLVLSRIEDADTVSPTFFGIVDGQVSGL